MSTSAEKGLKYFGGSALSEVPGGSVPNAGLEKAGGAERALALIERLRLSQSSSEKIHLVRELLALAGTLPRSHPAFVIEREVKRAIIERYRECFPELSDSEESKLAESSALKLLSGPPIASNSCAYFVPRVPETALAAAEQALLRLEKLQELRTGRRRSKRTAYDRKTAAQRSRRRGYMPQDPQMYRRGYEPCPLRELQQEKSYDVWASPDMQQYQGRQVRRTQFNHGAQALWDGARSELSEEALCGSLRSDEQYADDYTIESDLSTMWPLFSSLREVFFKALFAAIIAGMATAFFLFVMFHQGI